LLLLLAVLLLVLAELVLVATFAAAEPEVADLEGVELAVDDVALVEEAAEDDVERGLQR